MRQRLTLLALACVGIPALAFAQQTGAIAGKVTAPDGALLPGVTVEARSDVLPGPRVTVTGAAGEFRLPALPPGEYTVKFTLPGMQTATRQAAVQLAQDTVVDVKLSLQGVTEAVTVTAAASFIEREPTIKSALSSVQILALPVGQEYRDLIKLIPGVQFTQDGTRGPSAGGSGQDNVYQFDGVNVTLPLFGTLSAEPASHDIAQVTTTKGGAKAADFDRSGGFSVDSVSKSGTNRLSGLVSLQFQNPDMAAKLKSGTVSKYEQDRSWWNLNAGGPIVRERAYFYASYYRPDNSRDNRANAYGELPDYDGTRNEGFGKVTITPTRSTLVNLSYRDSHRFEVSDLFGGFAAPTTGTGNESWLKIGTAEASWIVDHRSYINFKYTHFTNRTQGRPDNEADVTLSTAIGTQLDTARLDQLGLYSVPNTISGLAAYNEFVQPIIERYGYVENGVRKGGGQVGYGSTFDKDDFFRDSGQIGYNITLGSTISHELHVGYQRYVDSEDLVRRSNGWGVLSTPGGRTNFQGTPIFYLATFQQQSAGVPTIHSEYRSQSFEFQDTIRWRDWSFNLGLIASNDTLYGQGLKNDPSTLSGFVLSTGTTPESRQYKMYEIPFSKLIQPRVGATYAYDGHNTVYASYAKYNPAANSLPRAASWDRSLQAALEAYFDSTGRLFGSQNVASSSGKLFVPDLTPRTVHEFAVGTSRQLTSRLAGRMFFRYREGSHFWEDTNNTARVAFEPPEGIPRELYIPNLDDQRRQIGNGTLNGSTYVITELDGAFTKYHEVTMEAEWQSAKVFVRGSYTWSRYYGNFDQDNTTGLVNDANNFIGSSNIADGAGRQLWNDKEGHLRGERPHLLKIYGYYNLPWHATAGAYIVAQSGQPWEAQSYEPYRHLTTNTNDSNRYAEPAGSRRTASHGQIDLKYTQNIPLARRFTARLTFDLFNVANRQTGYNLQPSVHSAAFGNPRNYFDPRRFQMAMQLQF